MHSRIYQISRKQISSDEFIDESTIVNGESWEDWADYICDRLGDRLDEEYKNFPFLDGNWKMFDREGDCLTYLGDENVMEEWRKNLDEIYSKLLSDFFVNDFSRTIIDVPHTPSRFYANELEYSVSSAEFIDYCHFNLKKGDKLYIGNVLDYHY